MEIFVAHHHRRAAATGETLDELDGEFSVLRRLQAVRVRIKAELRAKVFVQFVRTTERTTQRAADLDLMFARRRLTEHRIERHELVNVDGLQAEFLGDPLGGLG